MLSEHEKEQIMLVYNYYKRRGATKGWIPLLGLKASKELNLDIKTTKSTLEYMCNIGLMEVQSKQCRLASYEA